MEYVASLSSSADGQRLAVTVVNPSVRLWSVPISSSTAAENDVKPFMSASMRALAPRFHGKALYFLSSTGPDERLWRSDDGKISEIWRAPEGGVVEPPAISPDGRRIAITTTEAGKRRLQIISSDGAETTAIALAIDVEGSADWSPDGRWIVTGGNDGKGEGLFKIPAAGGAPVRLTSTAGRDPVWSPDGSMIAYSGPYIFTLTPLLAIRSDGTAIKMPDIRIQRGGERLRFMPDGRGLVFMQAPEATPWQDFWLLDLDTLNRRRLTRLTARNSLPDLHREKSDLKP